MMPIIWSPRAIRRLRQYARNLAEYDYPETAASWLNKVRSESEILSEHPQLGPISPEFIGKRPVVRDLTIGNYRLFYRVRRDHVEIISIHNCKQAITSLRSL